MNLVVPEGSDKTPHVCRGFRDLRTKEEIAEIEARHERLRIYQNLPEADRNEILRQAKEARSSDEMQYLCDGSSFPDPLDHYIDREMKTRI